MKRTNLHLDEDDYAELQKFAKQQERTAATLVRRAIRELLVKLRKESKRRPKS